MLGCREGSRVEKLVRVTSLTTERVDGTGHAQSNDPPVIRPDIDRSDVVTELASSA
jgi:hypothetical protein